MPQPNDPWKAQMEALGGFIKAQRQVANLSLREMARMTDVSNAYLSQIERGLHQPSVRVLRSLADALNVSAETLLTIAADPQRLGARIGILSVLHTWGSALTHHPHVHMIVPGGGFSLDGKRWLYCRPRYLLPVPVLSSLFRRLLLDKLTAAHAAAKAITRDQALTGMPVPLHPGAEKYYREVGMM